MDKITGIKVVAFDADDTLWENETFFRDTEKRFAEMLTEYASKDEVNRILYEVEMANMPVYGYGIKAFTLSLIETANLISGFRVKARQIDEIINLGKEMLNKPVKLFPCVEEVLKKLHGNYRLVVATKGDLLDQERKLEKSGLLKYFHHIEVMSDKNSIAYSSLIKHLDIEPYELMMIGNSLRSDVLPVVELGGHAAHIPFHTTWLHEVVSDVSSDGYIELGTLKEILEYL